MDEPEKSFEILRKLSSPSVAWVHGDEDSHRGTQVHFFSHEVKPQLLVSDGVLDALHLQNKRTNRVGKVKSIIPNQAVSVLTVSHVLG